MGRRRIEMFEYRQVLVRLRAGDSDREIARAGPMGREKVAALRGLAGRQGWLDASGAMPEDGVIAAAVGTARKARSTVSSVEPWRAQVARWLELGAQGKAIHATLCREHGYSGSYSSVHRLIQSIRAAAPTPATVALHWAPADAAQVDFGAGPRLADADGVMRRTWFFVMTLAYSRHQYVEFVWDQTVATWLGCHRRAFEWFGAVPSRLVIDNASCAITRACRTDPTVQRSYAECAEGYGFRIDACPPREPQLKGIVEAGVKYVKGNFLALRSFRDLADLNAQARDWVMHEASLRIHGTTRKPPLELFALERPQMRALPAAAPDLGTWREVSVHRDCHVKFADALYSAPFALVGKQLWLRATDTCVTLYDQYRHVATHRRAQRRGERVTITDHLPPNAARFLAHDRSWCLEQAGRIGARCEELVAALLSDRILEKLRAAQGVLRLAQQFSPARLEAACARALAHGSPHYRTVKTILAGGHDLRADPVIDTHARHGANARFARDAADLFTSDLFPAQPGRLH
jgi:transposase